MKFFNCGRRGINVTVLFVSTVISLAEDGDSQMN